MGATVLPLGHVDVRAHGAVGDGVTNDYAAIIAAHAAAVAAGHCMWLPAATYKFNTAIVVSENNTCWVGEPGTVLLFGGTGIPFTFNGPTEGRPYRLELHRLTIDGGANATNGIYLIKAVGFVLDRIRVTNVSGAGIRCDTCTTGMITDYTISTNVAAFSVQPTNGFLADSGLTANVSLINPRIEGVSGSGIKQTTGQGLIVQGGTSEGNAVGVEVNIPFVAIDGLDLEVNSSADLICGTGCYSGKFSGLIAASTVGLSVTGTAHSNVFTGGYYTTIALGASTTRNTIEGIAVSTSFTDAGLANRHYGLSNLATGGVLPDSRPKTIYISTDGTTDTICANAADTSCTLQTGSDFFATQYTIPAYLIAKSRAILATACFTGSTPAVAAAQTYFAYAGSTALYAGNGGVPTANVSGDKWCHAWTLSGSDVIGASKSVYVTNEGDAPRGFAAAGMGNGTSQPVSLNTNATQVFKILLIFTGTQNAGNYVTLNQLKVEYW